MVKVIGLSMGYHGNTLMNDASFEIQKGQRYGLIGRNGTGKTTIFRMLTGEETPDAGTIVLPRGYTLGVLNQHFHFTEHTLIDEAALGLRPEDKQNLYKIERILFGLGFTEEDLYLPPGEFSGGYQLRLNLAKVLVSEPDCLLLDEPTNYLDIVSVRWFAKFLQQWRGEFILISHDREFMDSVTTHTMGIHRQKVRVFSGSTIDFVEKIFQEEEIQERTSQNLDKKRAHLQSFIDRFGAKASKAVQAESRRKMLSRIPALERLKELYNLNFQFNEASFPGRKMIEVSDLFFSYPPKNDIESPLIVNGLNLEIEKGERIAIIGKNGRGKSTILKLLAKELEPNEGTIKRSENLCIGYFGQTNIDRLHPKHTIEDEVGSANTRLNITQVKAICGLMMFSGDMATKKTSMLSGGEKSRVLLGKILAKPCNLLLLDEPTHHLDMESIEALIDALEDFKGAVVLVTHSELILRRLEITKIIDCHEGRQELFLGGYDEFLEKVGFNEKGGKKEKAPKKDRDQKQQRANLVASRAKMIKPLETSISQIEIEVGELEKALHQLHTELADLSSKGNGSAIQEVSKKISTHERSVEMAYEKLDRLMVQRDEVEAKFKLE